MFTNLTTEILRNFLVPLPPLPEQKAIAAALSDVDTLITAQEALIAKKRYIKTATMQQLLTGKVRLGEFGQRACVGQNEDGVPLGYKHTELGVIPEDWQIKSFKDCFNFLTTSSLSRAELTLNGDVNYIHYGDIHTKFNNYISLKTSDLPKVPIEKIKNAKFIQEGDLVIADASEDYDGIGKSVEILNVKHSKIIAGLHTFLLRDKNHNFVDGYKGLINEISCVKSQMRTLATGLKVYGISKNNIKNILIPVPPISEQILIFEIIESMITEIIALEAQRDKTRAIKQGMMQELLTGKTRLVESVS